MSQYNQLAKEMGVSTLEVNLLSPVHIGTGEAYSSVSDYIIREDKLYFLNTEMIEEMISVKPNALELVEEYVKNIRANVNGQKNDFDPFDGFIRTRLTNNWREIVLKPGIPVFGVTKSEKIQLKPTIKSGGNSYIPGSTIKGAFKTAIYYHTLLNTDNGTIFLEKFAQQIKNLYKKHGGKISRYWDIKGKKKRDQTNFEQQELRDLEKDCKHLSRSFEHYIEILESTPQKEDDKRKPAYEFRHLLIGDSTGNTDGRTAIFKTQRLNTLDGLLSIPEIRETLMPSAGPLKFRCRVDPKFERKELRWLNNDNGVEQLLNLSHKYSIAVLNFELDRLKDEDLASLDASKVVAYRENLETIIDKVEANINSHFLRLGAGKTYHYNSLGLVLYSHDPEVYYMMIDLFMLGAPFQPFPLTRTVSTDSMMPFGYALVKFSEE